jgi:hypothetical protein
VAGVLLVAGAPIVADAVAPHLTCGPKQVGRWETIPVPVFQPVQGLQSSDTIRAYGLDEDAPENVVVTNGTRVLLSSTHGCAWQSSFALTPGVTTSQPYVGATASIVSVASSHGRAFAAVQEGSGSASRPHVVRFSDGAWVSSDSGLPVQGSPRMLRTTSDGQVVYLAVSPTATGGSDSDPTSPLPVPGGEDNPTGLLYATTDGGATWSLRTGPTSIPGGGTGFSQLDVDPSNPLVLYGIVAGHFVYSRDGGATFTQVPAEGVTAITAMGPNQVAAFTANGLGFLSYDGGAHVVPFSVPQGVTSATWRSQDSALYVEAGGRVHAVQPMGSAAALTTPARIRPGSLLGDRGIQSSLHAVAGHSLLRYVDPVPKTVRRPPIARGDITVDPPNPGVVTPAVDTVTLHVGQKATRDFSLDLPENPTPLDLFFLVDVSTSMSSYIDNLKQNIQKVVDSLTKAKINLKVGVGTLGTAPAEGEAPYPDTYVYPPNGQGTTQTYRKPRIYERLRAVGDTGKSLRDAIHSIKLETDPPVNANRVGTYHEGQLLALEQLITGSGVKTEQEDKADLPTYSAVAPGQQAGWRQKPGVRRIVVIASDEAFDVPYGTPQKRGSSVQNPVLDYSRTLKLLNDNHIGVFGITAGSPDSVADMQVLSRGTRTFAPAGGVSCGGEPEQILNGGDPLVCSQEGDFSAIIAAVLAQLTDVQDVTLEAVEQTPVLRALHGDRLRALNVKKVNVVPFSVDVSCVDVQAGSYLQDLDAMLRGTRVGSARLVVNCILPAVAPAIPPVAAAPPPAAAPVQVAAPPPPPPPAANPQPNPNPNIQPLTAGALQENQELQLAVALNSLAQDDQSEELQTLAMVDRRKRQEVQALGVLAFAMTACAGLGLATLRARPAVAPRRTR